MLAGLAALCPAIRAAERRIFDSHCHIIDHAFPLLANQGYTPSHFPLEQYLQQAMPLGVRAGAVVSGPFQAFDQIYLKSLLPKLGKGWIGVTQVPNSISKDEIVALSRLDIGALRFNMSA